MGGMDGVGFSVGVFFFWMGYVARILLFDLA
jgi:hypothetical protein